MIENIWEKVTKCVNIVSKNIPTDEILGIGFDATCSLVLIDENLKPLTASPTKNSSQNVIMWMDHRAEMEADFINSKNHDILKYVGGKVSLEMEVPKLLWLKKNLADESYNKIHLAFDLPDYLTWKATGEETRSACSVTCKWNYDAIYGKWSNDYFDSIGLQELNDNNHGKIGSKIQSPGFRIGNGLSDKAAKELGLLAGTAVGTSMIDAHAGAIGMLGSRSQNITDSEFSSKLVLIAGTSTCHMSVTKDILYSPGIWGPYKHALLSGYYLSEAGQSATGILIEHILKTHPAYQNVMATMTEANIYDHLYNKIMEKAAMLKLNSYHELTNSIHIWPDYHGNRSPISNSSLKGMINGLTMEDDIYVVYLATIQSLVYGTKYIIESLYESGRKPFKTILICGGLSKNMLFNKCHADICSVPVLISNEPECVLLGSAMLGAAASGYYKDLETAIQQMSSSAQIVEPDPNSYKYHSKKYKVFLKMLDLQLESINIMNS